MADATSWTRTFKCGGNNVTIKSQKWFGGQITYTVTAKGRSYSATGTGTPEELVRVMTQVIPVTVPVAKYKTEPCAGDLLRLVALRSFGTVIAGEHGGFISKYTELDHNGTAWVYPGASVLGKSVIAGDACVAGNAIVTNSRIEGQATVTDDAVVSESFVRGSAAVYESAQVLARSWVFLNARVGGKAVVEHSAIGGGARVVRRQRVYGGAVCCGRGKVPSRTIYPKCKPGEDSAREDPMYFRDCTMTIADVVALHVFDSNSVKYVRLPVDGNGFTRIRAMRAFGDVRAGDLGGHLSEDSELDTAGAAWIYPQAVVRGGSKITGSALVDGTAVVSNSRIEGEAYVGGSCTVDNSRVHENAVLTGSGIIRDSNVSGYARVTGASVLVEAVLGWLATVENSTVYNSRVAENAVLQARYVKNARIVDRD